MVEYRIFFSDRERTPEIIHDIAKSLKITPEELIRRWIVTGLMNYLSAEPAELGVTLEDFMVRNGFWKP